MRGYITTAINEREFPSVEADVLGFYNEGDTVEVNGMVDGDEYDGESTWYKLNNGSYIWSGGVNVEPDCSGLLLVDRQQFLFCYRKKWDAHPRLDTFEPADDLYVANTTLPSSIIEVRLQELAAKDFADNVVRSLEGLDPARKHVVIYVHGYQLISSLKMDLFSHFVQSYMSHKPNKIAKAIFFSWPSQGGPARKTVDDRSIRAGQDFTTKGLFRYFEELSAKLKATGRSLDLVVHSFGHQLLNGMLNPEVDDPAKLIPEKIFDHVFLMAPDITHLALQRDGAELKNYYKDSEGKDYKFNFKLLQTLANQVNIFYDEEDFLLYVSTKKFVEKGLTGDSSAQSKEEVRKYRSLGNYGAGEITHGLLEEGFTYWNIQELLKNSPSADLFDFPFQPLKRKLTRFVKNIRDNGDYSKVTALRVLFNSGRFTDHHRYLFTCKPVVDKVQQLLV